MLTIHNMTMYFSKFRLTTQPKSIDKKVNRKYD